jgi:hypothetical protein
MTTGLTKLDCGTAIKKTVDISNDKGKSKG